MKSKCKIFLFLIGSLFISIAQANNYLLTMSKNDDFCQHMYQVFNGDLRKKGKLALGEHKEFNWLKLDQEFFMIKRKRNIEPNFADELISKVGKQEEYATYTKYPKKGAYFDIDNNGEDEFITFQRNGASTFENRAYDSIYVYKGNALTKLSGAERNKQYTLEMGYLGSLIDSYTLKEYPIKETTVYKNGHTNYYWPHISDPFIRPLLFNNTYFIALFGNVDTHISDPLRAYNQTIDEKNAIAVVTFTPSYDPEQIKLQPSLLSTGKPSNETQDICYFVKTQVIQ